MNTFSVINGLLWLKALAICKVHEAPSYVVVQGHRLYVLYGTLSHDHKTKL